MVAGAYITACIEEALRLVNHPVDTVDDVAALLDSHAWLRERLVADDVDPLRRLRLRLSKIVDHSAAGDQATVVTTLNTLLDEHPVRPRIGGRGTGQWHLHVNTSDASAAQILTSESLFGLAMLVTELGADRLGRCPAPSCGRAFLDASPNRSRRFCSHRCATRVNVAAHRHRARTST